MGYYFHFSSFLGDENSGLKSRFVFCLIFQFYLIYRLICQKPAHFLSAQMSLVSTFFQMFIVFGMHNFEVAFDIYSSKFRSYIHIYKVSLKIPQKVMKHLSSKMHWPNSSGQKSLQTGSALGHFFYHELIFLNFSSMQK